MYGWVSWRQVETHGTNPIVIRTTATGANVVRPPVVRPEGIYHNGDGCTSKNSSGVIRGGVNGARHTDDREHGRTDLPDLRKASLTGQITLRANHGTSGCPRENSKHKENTTYSVTEIQETDRQTTKDNGKVEP